MVDIEAPTEQEDAIYFFHCALAQMSHQTEDPCLIAYKYNGEVWNSDVANPYWWHRVSGNSKHLDFKIAPKHLSFSHRLLKTFGLGPKINGDTSY